MPGYPTCVHPCDPSLTTAMLNASLIRHMLLFTKARILHNQKQDHSASRGGYLDLIIFCNLGCVCSASASLPGALKLNLFRSGIRPLATGDRKKKRGGALLREYGQASRNPRSEMPFVNVKNYLPYHYSTASVSYEMGTNDSVGRQIGGQMSFQRTNLPFPQACFVLPF